MEPEPGSPLRVARLIAGALPTGVVLFWIVAWFVTDGGREGLSPDVLSPRAALWLWAAVALFGFAGALAFRSRAEVGTASARSPGNRGEDGGSSAAQTQAYLIIAWALLEGPALLAGVLFMLLGSQQILWAAAVVYGVGVAMTFPRAEWFGER